MTPNINMVMVPQEIIDTILQTNILVKELQQQVERLEGNDEYLNTDQAAIYLRSTSP